MTLFIVPTPLGNLEDITQRALKVLGSVRAVLCEDTRRTKALLTHFSIPTPTLRYDERQSRGTQRLVERLQAGEDMALVSDGGTPVVSDPGVGIVAAARRAGVPVVSLPGPSAVAAAVAGSGLPGDSFVFLGFLPRTSSKQRRILAEAAGLGRTMVVYESPFRVRELIQTACEALGPGAQAVVAREISKVYEEWITGSLGEVLEKITERAATDAARLRGEFVVMIHPSPRVPEQGTSRLPDR